MRRTLKLIAGLSFLIFAPAALAQTAPLDSPQKPSVATPDEQNPNAPVPGKNSFTKDQVKQRLADAGYANPENLQLGDDGIWRGDAERDGKPVKALFDFQGNITTQ